MNLPALACIALVILIPQQEDKMPQKKADHDSIDTLVAALYAVISGPKDQKRDWKRFEALFLPGARLQTLTLGRDGKRRFVTMTPADYVKRSGKWAEGNGLFEKETHRSLDMYGHIAHVFSSYELRVGEVDKQADLTGINSIQCCQVDGKWRILSLLWEDARSAGPIPARYLPKGQAKDGHDREDR